MHKQYGQYIYGKYGFVDAFNPSFDYDVPLKHGRRVRGVGWVATDYLGIDQGAIISMIENHRSELMWTVMKRNQYMRRGLKRAGFEGGWLDDRWRSANLRALTSARLERELRHAPGHRLERVDEARVPGGDRIAPQDLEHGLVAFAPFGERHVEGLLDGVRHAARVVGIDHERAGRARAPRRPASRGSARRDRPDPAPPRIPWPPGSCRRAPA